MERDALIAAISEVASKWREPGYPPREVALEKTLALENRFTAEAAIFAVNQQMSLLTVEAMKAWCDGRAIRAQQRVAVLNPGNIPLVGLQDLVAVLVSGHSYRGTLSRKSTCFLPAFCDDFRQHGIDLPVVFGDIRFVLSEADALIASGSDQTAAWIEREADALGLRKAARLIRGHRISAAVVDGRESVDALEGLAEDLLLHEGLGCRNVSVLWAPAGASPDRLLESMTHFRAVFPAHPDTIGSLRMQIALLKALGKPMAHSDDGSFLLSRGQPEPQPACHVRWVEYGDLAEVESWTRENRDRLQLLVVPARIRMQGLPRNLDVVRPGSSQRPALDWRSGGCDVMQFLLDL